VPTLARASSRRRPRPIATTRITRTLARRIPAHGAPLLRRAHRKRIHLRHKVVPRQARRGPTEQRKHNGVADVAGRAVVEQKPDLQLVRARDPARARRAAVGRKELEDHDTCVVWDAVEVWRCGGQVGEAEEGEEAGVGAELDA